LEGYRHIPTNGPLFLLDAAAGFILAAVVLAWPRPLAGLLAAGYTAATLGALLISLAVGLFGFRESISASYVTQSLTIETITVLALITWTVLVTATPRAARRPTAGRPAAGSQSHQPMRVRVTGHLPGRVRPGRARRLRPDGRAGPARAVPDARAGRGSDGPGG